MTRAAELNRCDGAKEEDSSDTGPGVAPLLWSISSALSCVDGTAALHWSDGIKWLAVTFLLPKRTEHE